MPEEYYLGIDNGGSLTKAAIFDAQGRALAAAGEQVPLLCPAPGFTERDMETLWRANVSVIRRALADSGLEAAAMAGIPADAEQAGPVEQPGLDGAPVAFVLVRATAPLDCPAGLAVTPGWIGQAAVGVIA